MSLTEGAIERVLNNENVEGPIFQIMSIKKVDRKVAVTLFDGKSTHSYCMFGGQLLPRIESGEITTFTAIRLDKYVVKTQQTGKTAILVVDVTVIKLNNANTAAEKLTAAPERPTARTTAAPVAIPAAAAHIPSNVHTIPINLLNPYQNKWTIKGQVIKKNEIRTWNKESSSGKLFSFIMMDETCDIQITAFNAEVDRFYEMIEVGKTFLLSKGVVKVGNARFKAAKCDHEITLKQDSELTEVTSDDQKTKFVYDFVEITKVKVLSPGTSIDVAGVAHEVRAVTTITTRATNKEMTKRDVILVDRSGASISLTLWGEDTKLVDNLEHPVLIIRSAQISEFGGRCLNIGRNSIVSVNPSDIPEAQMLSGWYLQSGGQLHYESLSMAGGGSRETKKAVIAELACQNEEKSDWFMVECRLARVKNENMVYKACGKCNKKVVEGHDGLYTCQKCVSTTSDFVYRMMLNVNLMDHTGSVWVTAFQETGEKLIGKSAAEIGLMSESQDKEEINKLLSELVYRDNLCIKVSARNDTYNDETRLKVTMHDYSTKTTADVITNMLAALAV